MAESYARSRNIRYEIGKLVSEGKTFREAELIAMAGDSNRPRQVANWKKRGIYPYGEIDKPSEAENDYDLPSEVITKPQVEKVQKTKRDFTETFNAANITDEKIMRQVVEYANNRKIFMNVWAMQLLTNPETIKNVVPRIKRTSDTMHAVSIRLPEELLKRVREQIKVDNKGQTLSSLVETLLFEYLGKPEDLIDKERLQKDTLKRLLGAITKKERKRE